MTEQFEDFEDPDYSDPPEPTNKHLEDAFVAGAKFWEWHKTGATMWPSDQNFCLEKAREWIKKKKNIIYNYS
jgi:hypothetical protein